MRDRSARALEFAARMRKRRRSTVAAGGPRGTGESSAAEAERLKAKAVSLLASLEVVLRPRTGRTCQRESDESGGRNRRGLRSIRTDGIGQGSRVRDGAAQVTALSSLAPLYSVGCR